MQCRVIIDTWWRHQMETFSALLAICAGNSPVSGEFLAQRPVTRSFDVFVDVRLIKRLSKHSRGWWFETLSHPLWRHRNESNSDTQQWNTPIVQTWQKYWKTILHFLAAASNQGKACELPVVPFERCVRRAWCIYKGWELVSTEAWNWKIKNQRDISGCQTPPKNPVLTHKFCWETIGHLDRLRYVSISISPPPPPPPPKKKKKNTTPSTQSHLSLYFLSYLISLSVFLPFCCLVFQIPVTFTL